MKIRPMHALYLMIGMNLIFFIFSSSCSQTIPQYSSQEKINILDRDSLVQNIVKNLQEILDDAVNRHQIPGLQVCIQFPDRWKWEGVSGTLTPKRQKQLQNDHLMRIGSTTKMYTATLILSSIEQGKINLSDHLSQWFPAVTNAAQITITQLLNHTSGLSEILESFSPKMKSIFSHKRWKSHELLKIIYHQKPYAEPGKNFHYSNSNYVLLGLILEKMSGNSFENILQNGILSPCQIKNTFLLPTGKIPDRLITGFDRDLIPWPGYYEIKNDNTAWASLAFTSGAIAAPASDLLIFIDFLFNAKLVSKSTLNQMISFIEVHDADKPYLTGYGLGIARFNINDVEYWGHEGLFIGFESIAIYSPAKNYFITLIGNVSSFDKFDVIKRIQETITIDP